MLVLSWMIHTVTRKRLASTGENGDPSYTTAHTISARVEKRRAVVARGDGEKVTAQHVLATTTECRPTDLFWLPAVAGEPADDTTKESAARRPLAIEVATTKSGTESLWQVYF